jgi:hypothetical protein
MHVPEHHEERRAQMASGVLQAARYFRRHDIPGDADDEQFAESSIENQLRRHSRIAATEDGRIRMLALCEIGDDFPLHCRKSRLADDESFVPCFEAQQGFVGWQREFLVRTHTLGAAFTSALTSAA